MTEKLFLVILYNKDFGASSTLKSLQANQSLLISTHLLVWDNSLHSALTLTELENKFAQLKNVQYIHTSENWGLSKIYNKVIQANLEKYKYLVLFDDDSLVNINYLNELNMLINDNINASLILPRIIANNLLISPARLYYFLGSYLIDIKSGFISSKYITAINSGMVIGFNYLKESEFHYDEYLKFYCTDNNFMQEYSKKVSECYVMQSVLEHSLSQFDENETFEKKTYRFRQNVKGLLYLNKKNVIIYTFAHMYVLLYSIKNSIKFKSLKYIYYLWKN